MKSLRRFSSVIAVLVFGGLIWLAIYAYQDGFTKKWRKLIVKEFAKHDLNISFDRLTIDPFQGLVANNVLLLEHDTKQEVASISQVRLDLDLAKLIREEPFLERIELESADVSLPYARKDPASPRLELNNLNATVVLSRGRIEIARADADFYGLEIHLTGTVLRSEDDPADAPFDWQAGKIEKARPILENIVQHLGRIQSPTHKRPVLDLVLSGDLNSPETLSLKGQLDGAALRYESYLCERIQGEATVTRDSVKLDRLTLTDLHGRLDISGEFPLGKDRPAKLAADSTIDLGHLAPLLGPDLPFLSWMELLSAPDINLQGTMRLDEPFTWANPPVDVVGHMRVGAFRVGQEVFEELSGDFHIQGPRFFARNVALKHRHGQSQGKVLHTPEDGVRYEVSIGMDPTLLRQMPLMDGFAAFLDQWKFGKQSEVKVSLAGERKGQDAATWDHRGKATLTNCQYETAEIDKLALDFQLNPHAYHFSNMELQLAPDPQRDYSGGSVKAQRVSVSARQGLTMLTNITGHVDPGQVVRCFSPEIADQLDRFRFSRPPEIRIPQGTIDPAGISQTNLQVEVKAAGVLTTEILGEPLPLDQPRFGLLFHQENLIVRADHAGLFDGRLVGNVDIRNLSSSRDYTAKFDFDTIDFGRLAQLYFPEHASDGQLTGHFSWRGQDKALAAVEGKGAVHLLNSERMEIPVLGPLSSLVEIVIGKTRISRGTIRDLGTRFSIAASALTLESIAADLEAYRIHGRGKIDLETEAVDLTVSLMSQARSTKVLDVLYEIFGTYKCSGTLENPEWKMVNRFSSADLLKVSEILGDSDQALRLDPDKLLRLDPTGFLEGLLSREKERKTDEP